MIILYFNPCNLIRVPKNFSASTLTSTAKSAAHLTSALALILCFNSSALSRLPLLMGASLGSLRVFSSPLMRGYHLRWSCGGSGCC